jgi:hypothetical protein
MVDVLIQCNDLHLISRMDVGFPDVPYKGKNIEVIKHYRVKVSQ